jgi:hypothetical protein
MKPSSLAALVLLAPVAFCQTTETREMKSINPTVRKIVDSVSQDRIAQTLKKLETFGTRNTMSGQISPTQGIDAARQWILDQFKSFSPRLQVSLDSFHVPKGGRVTNDVDIANVVAVLPGTTEPDRIFVIGGHYDSLNLQRPDSANPQPFLPAPGVDDDGSGTATTLELARVMSQYEFRHTIVFIAFVAEEQGLLGATHYAQEARKANKLIDGVLNNDIIGTAVAGNGRSDTHSIHVFSPEPMDSNARELARYVKQIGERYVPDMDVQLIYRADRFGRGGDHTPFNREGFAAVRFTTANENFSHQHSPLDNFENVSVPYVTRVAKVNAAALASLALAPKAPVTMREGRQPGQLSPMLDRGTSGYDARLRWNDPNPPADLAGYAVVIRSTLAPYWEKEVFVGKTYEYTMPDVSIDEWVFGVKAVDRDGNESLVSAYAPAGRQ